MAAYSLGERREQIAKILLRANGAGTTIAYIAKQLDLSKHRVRQILATMTEDMLAVECRVEGSYHNYGLLLYFEPISFSEIAGFAPEKGVTYRLFQRTIFDLIGVSE